MQMSTMDVEDQSFQKRTTREQEFPSKEKPLTEKIQCLK